MTTEVVTTGGNGNAALSMKQITDRVNLVHDVLKKVMKENTHFGKVPGCGAKMVLLKPGADVLAMTFRLVPQFTVTRTDLENGHREYDVTCSMYGPTGELLGQGVGSASTMEKKYRYRKDDSGRKAENEDIADVYNTVLKIAKKRAQIDATLTVTGAADLFTQDLIDEDDARKEPIQPTTAKHADQAQAGNIETGPIEEVSEKKLTTGTMKYGVKVNGTWYGTFSKKEHGAAVDAKAQGRAVHLTWETSKDGKYKNAVKIEVAANELTDAEKAEIEAREAAEAGGELFNK